MKGCLLDEFMMFEAVWLRSLMLTLWVFLVELLPSFGSELESEKEWKK